MDFIIVSNIVHGYRGGIDLKGNVFRRATCIMLLFFFLFFLVELSFRELE